MKGEDVTNGNGNGNNINGNGDAKSVPDESAGSTGVLGLQGAVGDLVQPLQPNLSTEQLQAQGMPPSTLPMDTSMTGQGDMGLSLPGQMNIMPGPS